MELTERKKEILKEVIDAFIVTGEPVGSKAVMREMKTKVSSATIRNEMSDLEEMGLLEHPHTSAGRIPTGRGYRVYVDSLMDEYRLSFEETLLLNSLISETVKESDQVMRDVTKLLAKMTDYTVVSFLKAATGTIEHFEGVFVSRSSFLLVMITSSGKALTRQVQVGFPIDAEGVQFLIRVLNDHLAKKELGGITLERVIAMEKELGPYRALIEPILEIIYRMVQEIGKETVTVEGRANLFLYPEFAESGKGAQILCDLDDDELLAERFRDSFSDTLRVHIGSDSAGIDGTSYVFCPFSLGKGLEGAVCIIGPRRMNYAKAMARLEYLTKQINAAHGFEPTLPMIESKG